MLPVSNIVVGVDFGAPRRARDQRRKIIAIGAQAVADRQYRVDAIGINERLLAKSPPGWTAKELLDELLTRTVRIVAFDFPFSIPDALLRDEKFAVNAGYKHGAFIGWRTFNAFVASLASRSTSARSTPGARAPTVRACGPGALRTSWPAASHRSRTSSRRRSR